MEGDSFPIHLDKISKDPKCVAVAEMADLSPKFSNRSIAAPNLTLLYIKPTGCDNLLGDWGARKSAFTLIPLKVFSSTRRIVSRIVTLVPWLPHIETSGCLSTNVADVLTRVEMKDVEHGDFGSPRLKWFTSMAEPCSAVRKHSWNMRETTSSSVFICQKCADVGPGFSSALCVEEGWMEIKVRKQRGSIFF